MAVSRLHIQRKAVRQLLEASGIEEAEKARWRRLIPDMLPSELLRLKRNLLQQLFVDAQFETAHEIVQTKKAPKDNIGLLEMVLAKVLEKADLVEERTRSASSGQAQQAVAK